MTITNEQLTHTLLGIVLVACGGSEPAPAPPPAPAPVAASATPTASVAAVTAATVVPPAPPAPKLKLRVITGSPEGFLVNSTLITGDKDALLIDAQFTIADGKRVADAVKESGKNLTLVYVTHSHPDHYFGFVSIKDAFPNAKLVALPATVDEIEKTWEAKVKQWKPMYKEGITAKPFLPEPMKDHTLELEGEKLEVTGGVQGDEAENSYVSIPSLHAVVTGDIVYDQVFPWTAETSIDQRHAWTAAIDNLAAMNPIVVVPGHQKPERSETPENLGFTKNYLIAFDEALVSSKKPSELEAKMKAKYPDVALDAILKIGAEAAFKKPAKAPKKATK
ncbi:MAG TPA: MBL fold metallo-hydrolase [Polyangiaceae bacterium]|nr:MBL fold metallo-hydrolase [Polyangiaceae bacterium]